MVGLLRLILFLAVVQLAVLWPEEPELEEEVMERLLEKLAENKKSSSGSSELSIVDFPTQQSSTHSPYTSDKAVDGSDSTSLYPGRKCSHTLSGDDHPWWRVDLREFHCISQVTILNRGDCCSERLTNAVVRGGLSQDVTDNAACGSPVTSSEAKPRGGTIRRQCEKPLLARYISVDIPEGGILQLCEVKVQEVPLDQCLGSGDLSIVGFPTAQSSTHSPYTSDKAVDGSDSTSLYPGRKCSHTLSGDDHPWWRVDLRGVHCISQVTILNRGDCCSDRLTNAVVRGGLSQDVTDNVACGSPVTSSEAKPRGGTIRRQCEKPLLARYISVDIPEGGILQLCEVKVQEVPLDQCLGSGDLSIVNNPTEQSSTLPPYTSDKAVDGSTSTSLYPGRKCSHTLGGDAHPWWRVDLQGLHCISQVTILNRGDCCSDRLAGAVVRSGLNPDVTDNAACGSPITSSEAKPRGGTIRRQCQKPLLARYIGVDIPEGGILQLCEVTVQEVPLDQCKVLSPFPIVDFPTAQSSTHSPYTSDKAVDGSDSTSLYPGKKCSHTLSGKANPWWRVDLGDLHCITKVTILNRGDCCSDRLKNAVVRAGISDVITDNPACGSPVTAAQAAPRGGTIVFTCDKPLNARYVSVDIAGNAILQLCEVKVEEALPGIC